MSYEGFWKEGLGQKGQFSFFIAILVYIWDGGKLNSASLNKNTPAEIAVARPTIFGSLLPFFA